MEHLEINIHEELRFKDDDGKYKCGEVFMQSCEKSLIFICTCCDESFKELDTFTAHLFEELEKNKEESNVSEPAEDVYNASKTEDDSNTDLYTEDAYNPSKAEDVYNAGQGENSGNDVLAPMHTVFLCEESEEDSEPETKVDVVKYENRTKAAQPHSINQRKQTVNTTKSRSNLPKSSKKKQTIKPPKKSNEPTTYKCNVCEKIFKNKNSLRLHSFIHAEVKPFACEFCPMRFAHRNNLVVHRRRHTGETPYACQFCPRTFKASTECKIHMRFHTGDRPHVCEECGKGYVTATALKKHHRKSHLKELATPHSCDTCGKEFTSIFGLRSHIFLIHTDAPRDKKCDICGATFKAKKNLAAHKFIHKEKSFLCVVCGKAFAQKPGLYSHMKSHNIVKEATASTDK